MAEDIEINRAVNNPTGRMAEEETGPVSDKDPISCQNDPPQELEPIDSSSGDLPIQQGRDTCQENASMDKCDTEITKPASVSPLMDIPEEECLLTGSNPSGVALDNGGLFDSTKSMNQGCETQYVNLSSEHTGDMGSTGGEHHKNGQMPSVNPSDLLQTSSQNIPIKDTHPEPNTIPIALSDPQVQDTANPHLDGGDLCSSWSSGAVDCGKDRQSENIISEGHFPVNTNANESNICITNTILNSTQTVSSTGDRVSLEQEFHNTTVSSDSAPEQRLAESFESECSLPSISSVTYTNLPSEDLLNSKLHVSANDPAKSTDCLVEMQESNSRLGDTGNGNCVQGTKVNQSLSSDLLSSHDTFHRPIPQSQIQECNDFVGKEVPELVSSNVGITDVAVPPDHEPVSHTQLQHSKSSADDHVLGIAGSETNDVSNCVQNEPMSQTQLQHNSSSVPEDDPSLGSLDIGNMDLTASECQDLLFQTQAEHQNPPVAENIPSIGSPRTDYSMDKVISGYFEPLPQTHLQPDCASKAKDVPEDGLSGSQIVDKAVSECQEPAKGIQGQHSRNTVPGVSPELDCLEMDTVNKTVPELLSDAQPQQGSSLIGEDIPSLSLLGDDPVNIPSSESDQLPRSVLAEGISGILPSIVENTSISESCEPLLEAQTGQHSSFETQSIPEHSLSANETAGKPGTPKDASPATDPPENTSVDQFSNLDALLQEVQAFGAPEDQPVSINPTSSNVVDPTVPASIVLPDMDITKGISSMEDILNTISRFESGSQEVSTPKNKQDDQGSVLEIAPIVVTPTGESCTDLRYARPPSQFVGHAFEKDRSYFPYTTTNFGQPIVISPSVSMEPPCSSRDQSNTSTVSTQGNEGNGQLDASTDEDCLITFAKVKPPSTSSKTPTTDRRHKMSSSYASTMQNVSSPYDSSSHINNIMDMMHRQQIESSIAMNTPFESALQQIMPPPPPLQSTELIHDPYGQLHRRFRTGLPGMDQQQGIFQDSVRWNPADISHGIRGPHNSFQPFRPPGPLSQAPDLMDPNHSASSFKFCRDVKDGIQSQIPFVKPGSPLSHLPYSMTGNVNQYDPRLPSSQAHMRPPWHMSPMPPAGATPSWHLHQHTGMPYHPRMHLSEEHKMMHQERNLMMRPGFPGISGQDMMNSPNRPGLTQGPIPPQLSPSGQSSMMNDERFQGRGLHPSMVNPMYGALNRARFPNDSAMASHINGPRSLGSHNRFPRMESPSQNFHISPSGDRFRLPANSLNLRSPNTEHSHPSQRTVMNQNSSSLHAQNRPLPHGNVDSRAVGDRQSGQQTAGSTQTGGSRPGTNSAPGSSRYQCPSLNVLLDSHRTDSSSQPHALNQKGSSTSKTTHPVYHTTSLSVNQITSRMAGSQPPNVQPELYNLEIIPGAQNATKQNYISREMPSKDNDVLFVGYEAHRKLPWHILLDIDHEDPVTKKCMAVAILGGCLACICTPKMQGKELGSPSSWAVHIRSPAALKKNLVPVIQKVSHYVRTAGFWTDTEKFLSEGRLTAQWKGLCEHPFCINVAFTKCPLLKANRDAASKTAGKDRTPSVSHSTTSNQAIPVQAAGKERTPSVSHSTTSNQAIPVQAAGRGHPASLPTKQHANPHISHNTDVMRQSPLSREPVMRQSSLSREPVMRQSPLSREPVMRQPPLSREPHTKDVNGDERTHNPNVQKPAVQKQSPDNMFHNLLKEMINVNDKGESSTYQKSDVSKKLSEYLQNIGKPDHQKTPEVESRQDASISKHHESGNTSYMLKHPERDGRTLAAEDTAKPLYSMVDHPSTSFIPAHTKTQSLVVPPPSKCISQGQSEGHMIMSEANPLKGPFTKDLPWLHSLGVPKVPSQEIKTTSQEKISRFSALPLEDIRKRLQIPNRNVPMNKENSKECVNPSPHESLTDSCSPNVDVNVKHVKMEQTPQEKEVTSKTEQTNVKDTIITSFASYFASLTSSVDERNEGDMMKDALKAMLPNLGQHSSTGDAVSHPEYIKIEDLLNEMKKLSNQSADGKSAITLNSESMSLYNQLEKRKPHINITPLDVKEIKQIKTKLKDTKDQIKPKRKKRVKKLPTVTASDDEASFESDWISDPETEQKPSSSKKKRKRKTKEKAEASFAHIAFQLESESDEEHVKVKRRKSRNSKNDNEYDPSADNVGSADDTITGSSDSDTENYLTDDANSKGDNGQDTCTEDHNNKETVHAKKGIQDDKLSEINPRKRIKLMQYNDSDGDDKDNTNMADHGDKGDKASMTELVKGAEEQEVCQQNSDVIKETDVQLSTFGNQDSESKELTESSSCTKPELPVCSQTDFPSGIEMESLCTKVESLCTKPKSPVTESLSTKNELGTANTALPGPKTKIPRTNPDTPSAEQLSGTKAEFSSASCGTLDTKLEFPATKTDNLITNLESPSAKPESPASSKNGSSLCNQTDVPIPCGKTEIPSYTDSSCAETDTGSGTSSKVKVPKPDLVSNLVSMDEVTTDELWASLQTKGNMHFCDCGLIFQEQALYYLHRSTHSTDNLLKCNLCRQTLKDVNTFITHFFEGHGTNV